MLKFKNYLFDLDGTLTDPGVGIKNSIRYALKKFGLPIPPESILNEFIGPPLIDSFIKHYGFTRDRAVEAVSVYREYYSEKGLYENWDQIQIDYRDQLKRLEDANLSPQSDKRIKRLKTTFAEISKKVKHYALYIDRLKEQDYYHANPHIVEQLNSTIQTSVEVYAEQYLPQLLETQPQLICHQPNTDDNYESILIDLCAQIKKTVMQDQQLKTTDLIDLEKI